MKKIRNEQILYLLAFLIALSLRLLNLGQSPLSDVEASWALQSLALAGGDSLTLGAQPGYILPTTLLIFLFDNTNFIARLLPALAGSLLVFAPYAFRQKLGRNAAVIIAFGLAFDPGLVALSRLAGGPMLAIALTVLALALFYAGQYAWGGVAAGWALLSGPAIITGLLGLGIPWVIASLTGLFKDDSVPTDEPLTQTPDGDSEPDWRRALIFGLGTIVIVATLFFRFPQGLGAWAATISAYVENWTVASQIPAGRLLATLFFYAILPLGFGLIGAIRGWTQKQSTARILSIWLLTALFLPLLMPGREVGDIAWALIPLWALTGIELSRYAARREHWLVSLGQATAVAVLMVIIWLTLAALDTSLPENIPNYWMVAGAAVVIGILVTALVYLGWSWATARDGLVWGVVAGLGIYSLASVFGVSQVHPNSPKEWWQPVPTTRHADLLDATVRDLALTQTGHAEFIEVVSVVDAPSLRWALRNTAGVEYVTRLDPEITPLIVITDADNYAGLRQDLYRGQDFGWWDYPGWGGALPWEPIKWLTSREAPILTENLIIWVRLDLFPDEPVAPTDADLDENLDDALPPAGEGVEVDE